MLERAATHWLRALHNKTSCTLVPTRDTADELAGKGFERLVVLGRGVDTRLFSPSRRSAALRAAWRADENTPVAVFVGRLAPEKNLALAARTFEMLQRLEPRTKCVFVGDGPQRKQLESDHPEFIYAGMRSGEDLAAHYASADIFVFPSLTETFGNVLLEALASGLVNVSFDYACSQQLIEDGSNGFKAPFGDEDAFLAKAAEALRHWSSPSVGDRARRTARALSWEAIVRQFESNLSVSVQRHPSGSRIMNTTRQKKQVLRFKTIFLSDIHLGTSDCKITQVTHFLRNTRCEKLVLNGDIIDAWNLRRSGKWEKSLSGHRQHLHDAPAVVRLPRHPAGASQVDPQICAQERHGHRHGIPVKLMTVRLFRRSASMLQPPLMACDGADGRFWNGGEQDSFFRKESFLR
jgi:hypothetical protein